MSATENSKGLKKKRIILKIYKKGTSNRSQDQRV